jgi:hypothetical protein
MYIGAFIMKFKNLLAIILSLALVLTLTACGSDPMPEPQPNPIPEFIEIGDVIQFGAFDWRVLDVQDGKALIISDTIVTQQRYHSGGDITWEHSTIRQYLNGEFCNSFSSAEQGLIAETTIINNDNPIHGTAGGNNTTDNIFLLSIDEAEMYFPNDTSRIAVNADGEASWWWLRSPGFSSISAADVIDYGDVNVGGNFADIDNGGVRPALWLNL